MTFHRGYSEDHQDVALQWFVTRRTARRRVKIAAIAAAVIFGALGFAAGSAWGETISISGSMVTLEPSSTPGELATVTFDNFQMNGGHDNGVYPLAMPGLALEVVFTWEVGMFGEDSVTVLPPEGILCIPESCTATAMEGYTANVVLFDWRGM